MSSLEKIIANNSSAESLLQALKTQLCIVRNAKISEQKERLRLENAQLREQINSSKLKLIKLEKNNNKLLISVPGNEQTPTSAATIEKPNVNKASKGPASVEVSAVNATPKPEKEKKPKKENPNSQKNEIELPVDVGRLDMRVGKIIEVDRHPDADSLYLEKIDCGEEKPRTVVSGLVKFVPIEEMRDRSVIVLCNLKPAKMRGVTSEAMVMCASTPDKVEVLSPPVNAVPGDLVECDGYARQPDAQLNPKKKIFETVAPDLKTNDNLVACYKGSPLIVPGKGAIAAQTLKNVNVK